MDILNNREIAIAIWLLVISIYIFSSSKMAGARAAFKGLLSAFFVRQIVSILCLMVAYMAVVIYWLAELGLWNVEQLKILSFGVCPLGSCQCLSLNK